MRLGAYPQPERKRLTLLKALASEGPEPFVAAFGFGDGGKEIVIAC